jgi:hypothetical protein
VLKRAVRDGSHRAAIGQGRNAGSGGAGSTRTLDRYRAHTLERPNLPPLAGSKGILTLLAMPAQHTWS